METLSHLRQALPYINEHRNKILLILLPTTMVTKSDTGNLTKDLTLLHSLGLKLVIVPFLDIGGHPVDKAELERSSKALDSTWQHFNSCRTHLRLPTIQAFFCTARPKGVIDGVDHQNRGLCRQVEAGLIDQALSAGQVIWLSPLAYSPRGSAYLLDTADMAMKIASTIAIDKLIAFIRKSAIPTLNKGGCSPESIKTSKNPWLEIAYKATINGVNRVHLLPQILDGALLIELYTRDGCGVLINRDDYDIIRPASYEDAHNIYQLIAPYQKQGMLVWRGIADINDQIGDFFVMQRDGSLVGCYALHDIDSDNCEIACLVIARDARHLKLGSILLDHAKKQAQQRRKERVLVLTTQAVDWFEERGFQPLNAGQLPRARAQTYSLQRNSKVLCHSLT